MIEYSFSFRNFYRIRGANTIFVFLSMIVSNACRPKNLRFGSGCSTNS